MKKQINTVEEYIFEFPIEVQKKLECIRKAIKENAPEALESTSYGMPAYKLNKKPLVYFGGFSNHIGFYATPKGHKIFEKELSKFKQGKGSVQFPLDQPVPISLINEIVKFRVSESYKK